MKIAVTGARGRLGSVLVSLGCIPLEADILSPKVLLKELDRVQPDTIIHCAAVTDVDKCENIYSNKARSVNYVGTSMVRNTFRGRIIYISTDYVFNGREGPYKETSAPDPINYYGMTKYQGEEIIKQHQNPKDVIVRTTVLYGGHKPDFVTKVLDQLKSNYAFEVTKSVIGTPTYVVHLADALIHLCHMDWTPQVINIAGGNLLSRYEFALMIANVWGYDPKLVLPTKSVEGCASRPVKGGLNIYLAKKIGIPIHTAEEGLEEMKERMK
jgi:dTDP-4-dehydrorhamnose reductase